MLYVVTEIGRYVRQCVIEAVDEADAWNRVDEGQVPEDGFDRPELEVQNYEVYPFDGDGGEA